MSEDSPPGVAEGVGRDAAQGLSPAAIEGILADFRAWLQESAASEPAAPAAEAVDLHNLVAQFTALRHEVHLQTRAARAQQEQGADALRQLEEALAALQQAQLKERFGESEARDEALRPILKTLVDVYDALALAEREVRRVQDTLLPLLVPPASTISDGQPVSARRLSFWARLFGHRDLAGERALRPAAPWPAQVPARARQMLASVLTGYTMSLQRVERALRQHELEPIPTVGQLFDPESMEVLEVVADSDRPSGEVVGEVRRGYLWRGRVFRHAQVRVAKP